MSGGRMIPMEPTLEELALRLEELEDYIESIQTLADFAQQVTDRFVVLVARRLGLRDDIRDLRSQAYADAHAWDLSQCQDCDRNVHDIGEYFMVHTDVWNEATDHDDYGFLCVGCLEDRLGRYLTPGDFTGAPCNVDPRQADDHSARLRDRLTCARLFNGDGEP